MDSEPTPPASRHPPASPSQPADPGDPALDDTDPNIMPPFAVDPAAAVPPPARPPQAQRVHPAQRRQPPRRGRRGLVIGIVAGVVVAAAAAGGTVVLLRRGVPPATMARESGQAIASAAGLRLTGTIAGGNARLTVTRAGTVQGSYTQAGSQVSQVTIQGVTYLSAPVAFWRSAAVGETQARQAAGTWARAPAGAIVMSFGEFTPARVAGVLEHAGTNPSVVTATLDGTKVIRLFARGASYDISATRPYRLLRIDGASGTRVYSFDVTPLDAAAIAPVFTSLHADVQALGHAADPQARVLPLERIRFGPDCGRATSCTVHSRARVTAPGSVAVVVTMTVDFSATRNATPFTTCTAATSTTTPGIVSQTCVVRGRVWSRWFDSHTGNFTTWADAHFDATVNSPGDVAALQRELDREQSGD